MTTITQTITALPTAPARSQTQAVFDANISAWIPAVASATTQINTWATQANTVAGEVNTNAANAAISATNADASASAASASSGVTIWVSGTTYAIGNVRFSPIDFQSYRRKTAGAGTTDPSADTTNWERLVLVNGVVRSARTANTILGTADRGTLIDITSGTFTQTFNAAASLGASWFCYIRNAGTGDITLDPNAAETIDGLATFIMYPGETRLVQCDGTALRSIVLSGFKRVYTTSGTFVKPPGYRAFAGLVWSAGASGQRTNSAGTLSKGGGGGGCFNFDLEESLFAASESVTIGAGGAAVTTVADGNLGGNTSIGTVLVCYAGTPFNVGGSILSGAVAVADTVANYEGGANQAGPRVTIFGGGTSSSNGSSAGKDSLYGATAGGSIDASAVVRAPGVSIYGGGGGAASSASNGTNGSAPGGGGGATQTGAQSGAGARGELRIWGVV